MWTVEWTRPLNLTNPDDKALLEGKVYTFSFAVHDDNIMTRRYHVSFPVIVGFDRRPISKRRSSSEPQAGGYHCHRGALAGQPFSSKDEMLLRKLSKEKPEPKPQNALSAAGDDRQQHVR